MGAWRAAIVWLAAAACARGEPTRAAPVQPPPPARSDEPRVTRGAPSAFLDVAGLTQVVATTTARMWWGEYEITRIDVIRDGKVVCTLPRSEWSNNAEHASRTSDRSEIEIVSRDPLRLRARTTYSSASIGRVGHADTCTLYELPAAGPCQQLAEHACEVYACTPATTVSRHRRGTGRISGHITHVDGVAGAIVFTRSESAFVADDGTFALDAGPGDHAVQVAIAGETYDLGQISLAANENADVTVAITCGWSAVSDPP